MSNTPDMLAALLRARTVYPSGMQEAPGNEVFVRVRYLHEAADTLEDQAKKIEAILKVRAQYADQARFADIDCAVQYREFIRRIDAALKTEKAA